MSKYSTSGDFAQQMTSRTNTTRRTTHAPPTEAEEPSRYFVQACDPKLTPRTVGTENSSLITFSRGAYAWH